MNKISCKRISRFFSGAICFILQIVNEVELHKSIKHRFVVDFQGYFEDEENVYILLELCSRKVSHRGCSVDLSLNKFYVIF